MVSVVSVQGQADPFVAFRLLVGMTEATVGSRQQNKSFYLVARK